MTQRVKFLFSSIGNEVEDPFLIFFAQLTPIKITGGWGEMVCSVGRKTCLEEIFVVIVIINNGEGNLKN